MPAPPPPPAEPRRGAGVLAGDPRRRPPAPSGGPGPRPPARNLPAPAGRGGGAGGPPPPGSLRRARALLRWSEVQDLGVARREGGLEPHRRDAMQAASRIADQPPGAPMRDRISSGLILVRTPDQAAAATDAAGGRREYQAVLVQGRLSYAFSEFAHGRYDRQYLDSVRQLLAQMTLEERMVIYTLDFDDIWDRIWVRKGVRSFNWRGPVLTGTVRRQRILRDGWPAPARPGDGKMPNHDDLYLNRKGRFVQAWLSDDASAAVLRQLVQEAAGTGRLRWEFPKGKRLGRAESDLSCAIREFGEETQIHPRNYLVLPGFCRVERYVHMNVLYINTYYLAVLTRPIADPAGTIRLANSDQVSEVSDVRWMGLADMRLARGPVGRDLTVMGKIAFGYVRGRNSGREAGREAGRGRGLSFKAPAGGAGSGAAKRAAGSSAGGEPAKPTNRWAAGGAAAGRRSGSRADPPRRHPGRSAGGGAPRPPPGLGPSRQGPPADGPSAAAPGADDPPAPRAPPAAPDTPPPDDSSEAPPPDDSPEAPLAAALPAAPAPPPAAPPADDPPAAEQDAGGWQKVRRGRGREGPRSVRVGRVPE